jgi:hypothetical protein
MNVNKKSVRSAGGKKMSEVECKFKYEQDSKRFHRFKVESEEGITGSIYVPRDANGIPERIVLVRDK